MATKNDDESILDQIRKGSLTGFQIERLTDPSSAPNVVKDNLENCMAVLETEKAENKAIIKWLYIAELTNQLEYLKWQWEMATIAEKKQYRLIADSLVEPESDAMIPKQDRIIELLAVSLTKELVALLSIDNTTIMNMTQNEANKYSKDVSLHLTTSIADAISSAFNIEGFVREPRPLPTAVDVLKQNTGLVETISNNLTTEQFIEHNTSFQLALNSLMDVVAVKDHLAQETKGVTSEIKGEVTHKIRDIAKRINAINHEILPMPHWMEALSKSKLAQKTELQQSKILDKPNTYEPPTTPKLS